jgi:hypothetical protein
MGEHMRRYRHPLTDNRMLKEEYPSKEIRLLGNDLVLFQSTSVALGLIGHSCPHRKANLSYRVPGSEGIRSAIFLASSSIKPRLYTQRPNPQPPPVPAGVL